MSKIYNKKETKQFISDMCDTLRPGRFTSVSQKFLDDYEAFCKRQLCLNIKAHRSNKRLTDFIQR